MHTMRMFERSLTVVLILNLGLLAGDSDTCKHKSGKQTASPTGETRAVNPGHPAQLSLVDADKLIGSTVQNLNQEKYGKVENLILNPERNRVCYAVVSLEPITGTDDKMIAIPWTSLEPKSTERVVAIDLPKDKLSSAPTFNGDKYPALDNPSWWTQADRHFGQEDRMKEAVRQDRLMDQRSSRSTRLPAAAPEVSEVAPTEPRPGEFNSNAGGSQWGRLVSELDGVKVENASGEKLGTISKFMIDLPGGHLAYAIVSFGGVLGVANDEAAVPWSAIAVRPTDKVARAQTDNETLKAIAFKAGESSDNLSDRAYAERIYSQFHQEPYWEVFGYVGSAEDARFDAANIKTVEGTVESITSCQADGKKDACQELHLRDSAGGMICVRLAPAEVVQKHGLRFENGDKVKATGSLCKVGDRSVLIATELRKGEQNLQLRDAQGKELWRSGTEKPCEHDSHK